MAYAYHPGPPPFMYEPPPSAGVHHPYSPRYAPPYAGGPLPRESPKHTRHASQPYGYSARMPPQYSAYAPRHTTMPQSTPNVSGFDYDAWAKTSRPRPRAPTGTRGKHYYYERIPKRSSEWQYVNNVFVEEDYDQYYDAPPPPYEKHHCYDRADHRQFYGQVPQYTYAEPMTPKANSGRPRRASQPHAARPHPTTPKRPSTAKASPRKATAEDARQAGIPAGYSYKNWDPTEEPIILLGSVFDANSLGKWIYDWTVYYYGPATPMSDVAGDLWLLLIQLAGKVKRADDCIDRIRQEDSRELVEDFLESGERLWVRFKKLLKVCEDYMWKAAQRETGDKRPVTMGRNSGCEFVDSIFGRDRELDKTEKLMSAIRLWSMRFDANCDEILRNPAA